LHLFFIKKKIDLNINNSQEFIDIYQDFVLIDEDYMEWKINDWKTIKPGRLYESPLFNVGNNIW